jgi:hypothetical protein
MWYTDLERDAIHASAMAASVNQQNMAGTILSIEAVFDFYDLTTIQRVDFRSFVFSSAHVTLTTVCSRFLSVFGSLRSPFPVPYEWVNFFLDPATRGSYGLLLFDTSYNPSPDGVYLDYFEIRRPPLFSWGRFNDE